VGRDADAEVAGVAITENWTETVHYLGPRTAEAVMAWVDDPSRFQRIKSAGRYFGLAERSAFTRDTGFL